MLIYAMLVGVGSYVVTKNIVYPAILGVRDGIKEGKLELKKEKESKQVTT